MRWTLTSAFDNHERASNFTPSYSRDMIDACTLGARRFLPVTGVVAAILTVGLGLATPAAAQVSDQTAAAGVYAMTLGRGAATVAVVVGLIGAAIGGRALARTDGRSGDGRRGALLALVMGPMAVIIGGLVVVAADGGLGTGNGLGGGVVAMIVGLIGTALGGLALARQQMPSSRGRAGNVVD